jgi:hypothetical protein
MVVNHDVFLHVDFEITTCTVLEADCHSAGREIPSLMWNMHIYWAQERCAHSIFDVVLVLVQR